MLTKCVNCGFYVSQTDVFCLSCGIKNPNETLKKRKRHKNYHRKMFRSNGFLAIFSLFSTFIFVYILADRSIENFIYLINYILFGALVLWIFLFYALFVFLKTLEYQQNVPHILKYKNNLNSKTKIIDNRIAELSSRGHRIDAVLDKIKETDGKNLQEVRQNFFRRVKLSLANWRDMNCKERKLNSCACKIMFRLIFSVCIV